MFKAFIPLTLRECGDFISTNEVRESLLVFLVFSIFYMDGSNSFPGYEIKGRKTLRSVERAFQEMHAVR